MTEQAGTRQTEGPDAGPHPVVDPSPFDFAGRGPGAALCLHGLTATPYEVRPLGEAIAAEGIRAVGPRLPGHGESPERLAAMAYSVWLGAARDQLHALRARHDRVFITGVSLGGLLGLALAAEEPVDGLAVIGTPLHLGYPQALLAPVLKYVISFIRKRHGSDIRDRAARERHPTYPVMPMASIHELQRLQRRVRRGLGRVQAPILVAHGALDRTARTRDARRIAAGVGSPQRELLILANSGHIVPVDRDGPQLASAIANFFSRLLS